MPRRGLITLIFTIAGLRLIVGYVPPAQAGIGGIVPDPLASPDPLVSASPDVTPTASVDPGVTPNPTVAPSAKPGASGTPVATATPKPTATPAPTAAAAAMMAVSMATNYLVDGPDYFWRVLPFNLVTLGVALLILLRGRRLP
jgi:hypothetical protein